MSNKIRNINLAGLDVLICGETVKFDEQGVGEIQSDEAFKVVLGFPGYAEIAETDEKAQAEAAAKAKAEAEAKALEEAKAKEEADAKAKAEAGAKS